MSSVVRRTHPLISPAVLARRALIYLRQSTVGQTVEHWGSTEVQRDQVEAARAFGWRDDQIECVEEDLGRSAATAEGRSGFARLLKEVANGTVGAIFAGNVGRLARQVFDFEALRVLCRIHNVILVLDGRPCDPGNPADTVLTQIQAAFAEHDNRVRADGMRRARLKKASLGKIVSTLPVGWIEGRDGEYEFDPAVKHAIDLVFTTFRQVGSLRGTVMALRRAGARLPSRIRGQIEWREPRTDRVGEFIHNEPYAGTYVFGRTELIPYGDHTVQGRSAKVVVPEERWIRLPGRLPAYVSAAEQQGFRDRLTQNGFANRSRPGRGKGLCQGLLRCGRCGSLLTMCAPEKRKGAHRYQCCSRAATFGVDSCFSITGSELDAAVERLLLAQLTAPPLTVLRAALEAEQAAGRAERDHREAEHQRLCYEESAAKRQLRAVDPDNRRVHRHAQGQLEKAIAAREDFELQIAQAEPDPSCTVAEDEIRRLCEIASDVPGLWADPRMSNIERKEILRCLTDEIVVNRCDEAVDATIRWASGAKTDVRLLRQKGLCRLIAQLHGEGKTAEEIRSCLEGGLPTGQRWIYTRAAVYQILRQLGLKLNPARRSDGAIRDEITRLYESGRTYQEIVDSVNARGWRNSRGRALTIAAVSHWLGRNAVRRTNLEALHAEVLRDAKLRGLTNAEAADEFNRRGIPRVGLRSWTAEKVRVRRSQLKRRTRKLAVGAAGQGSLEKEDP
jgi:DNA invertase Pin-like site-specific DNA recombinase